MRTILIALLLLAPAGVLLAAAPAASACTNDHCGGGPCRITYTYADPDHVIRVPSGAECGPA